MSGPHPLPELPSLALPQGKTEQLEALRAQVAEFAAIRRARERRDADR